MKKLLMILSLLLLVAGVATASASTYLYDFNTGTPTAEWSGPFNQESVQGYNGLGSGSNVFSGDFLRNESGGYGLTPTPTVLTLTGLPAHTSVSLSFLLAIIGSWDGTSNLSYAGYPYGPDFFNVSVDGRPIFSQTLTNFAGGSQSYSVNNRLGGLIDRGFNYTYPYNDSAYNLGLDPALQNIPHTGDTLTVEWFADGAGWQGINALFGNTHDESWAIDDVSITLNGPCVPLPGTLFLLGSGLLGLAGWRGLRTG